MENSTIYAYASIKNDTIIEYPIYEGDLKLSVGYNDNESEVPFECPEGYVIVYDTIPPDYPTDVTKTLKEKTPEKIDDLWYRVWAIEDCSEEELEFRKQRKEKQVREERNRLLFQTDWTQLADSPVDSELWSSYRQNLRDITSQEKFPWDVEWPTSPSS